MLRRTSSLPRVTLIGVVIFFAGCCAAQDPDVTSTIVITSPTEGATLPAATESLPYNGGSGVQFSANRSTEAKLWTIDASSPDQLPANLTLDINTGLLSGTPGFGTAGTYTIMVRADQNCVPMCIARNPDVNTYTLIVYEPVQITTTALDGGVYGEDYSFQVQWTGGVPALNFSLTTGLPAGLTIGQTTGLISGTLADDAYLIAPYQVTINVQDSSVPPTSHSVTLDLAVPPPPLDILTSALPGGEIGTAYTTTALVAYGGIPAYTWTVSQLPPGLSATDDGVISGTPLPGSEGMHALSVSVTDSCVPPTTTQVRLPLMVSEAGTNPLTITTSNLGIGAIREDYNPRVLSAIGGTAPYTWTVIGLPDGLTRTGDTITGSPESAGVYAVRATVTDAQGQNASVMLTLLVEDDSQVPSEEDSGEVVLMTAPNLLGAAAGGCALGERSGILAISLAVVLLVITRRSRRTSCSN